MRSYGQYCAVAKALDVIGDRWTLLIVRELLAQGPCRYTDLRRCLPGIATNLLAERLRELEHAGVLVREDAPPPVATALFSLTPRGEQLRTVVYELGRWGIPLMVDTTPDEEYRSHWLQMPVELYLADDSPEHAPTTIEVRAGEQPMLIEARNGTVSTRPGESADADAVLSGPPQIVLGVLTGALDPDEASERGLRFDGERAALERLQRLKFSGAPREGRRLGDAVARLANAAPPDAGFAEDMQVVLGSSDAVPSDPGWDR
jgi:DNA-binding HxlR family transcriptional regulator